MLSLPPLTPRRHRMLTDVAAQILLLGGQAMTAHNPPSHCKSCNTTKRESDFYKTNHSTCITCCQKVSRERQKEHYAAKKARAPIEHKAPKMGAKVSSIVGRRRKSSPDF